MIHIININKLFLIYTYFSFIVFVDRAILSLTAMKNTSSLVDKK